MKSPLAWTARADAHIARHGVTRIEVEQAIERSFYFRKAGGRRTILGRTASRVLFLVVEDSREVPGFAEVVTARDATLAEKRLLERRGKGLR